MRRISKILGVVLVLGIVFTGGLFVGRYLVPVHEFQYVAQHSRNIIPPVYWQAWDQLHEHFIGELNDEKLRYGTIAGMVRAAGDPYTIYSPPAETKQFEENLSGSFSGIGVEIGMRNGIITVIAPLEGSPAKAAGIRAGDIVGAVDKKPITAEATLDEVVQQIRGQEGTTVTLTVVHPEERETTDITITRATIEIESVKLSVEEGIAHISITSFAEDTNRRFDQFAKQIVKDKVRGVILDMRGNPGGFLQSAVDISSHFLPRKTVVVTERGKTDKEKEYTSRGANGLETMPVVVLIDNGSASASEIVAGALRDQRQVPVVGVKSFGKGSVQEMIELDDESSLRVTIAKWFTPKGESIDQHGITPTIEIKDNPDTPEDEQLIRAREELKRLTP
jgi:carboxyl-terminal processing protease